MLRCDTEDDHFLLDERRYRVPETEINQLTHQFWVTKEEVVAEEYDLSASRRCQAKQEEAFFE